MADSFAKLYDTAHGQILYAIDDTEEDEPCIRVRGAYVDGVKPEAVLTYNSESDRDAAFLVVNQANAEGAASSLAAAVAGLGDPHAE